MNTGSLQSMVPKIINEAETYFREKWQDEGVADLRQTFAELVILTASATLMGREVREQLFTDVSRIYTDLDNGLTPLSVIWPTAPTAAHRARDKARKEMVSIFSKIISARREKPEKERDFLQTMIDFKYKDVYDKVSGALKKEGSPYKDSEVVGLLIVLLFAGQATAPPAPPSSRLTRPFLRDPPSLSRPSIPSAAHLVNHDRVARRDASLAPRGDGGGNRTLITPRPPRLPPDGP